MPTGLATPSAAEAAQRRPSSSHVGRLASSESIEAGGFTPGTVLIERYRIIGLVGRGGMGEVYRADDLKLGQPVALKFLPKELSSDRTRQDRFFAEVRTARQVSHPNVCRVYDIAEAAGQHFLSMEYVDGEDLASLLRRIGRLPQDKALDIARQLCAGLAAAHDRGVLHRDLKPSNVMVDGRGRARITDFGLAVAAGEAAEGELSGTPAYMAPEQFMGETASVRSDIYALGLVLYELCTGKKAVDSVTFAGYRKKHADESPTAPSEIVKEMDPAVERVILRCLEKNPQRRPASAAQVALTLPGGDPLAAAIAAGETPSPEMVAAGRAEMLKPAAAGWCLAAVFAGSVAAIFFAPRTGLHGKVPLEKPPEALAERAKEILRKLGYTEKPVDSAYDFRENNDYLDWVDRHDRTVSRWDDMADGRPAGIFFWYRESPEFLVAVPHQRGESVGDFGRVTNRTPDLNVPGMTLVLLDPLGRLISLRAVPPQLEGTAAGPAATPGWAALFAEAGLDATKFAPTPPRLVPASYADERAAWAETAPERADRPLRVEAASYRGRPVLFELVGLWNEPRAAPAVRTGGERLGQIAILAFWVSVLLGSLLVARRNLRLGRGDRKAALRLATFVLLTFFVSNVLSGHHVPVVGEFSLLLLDVSWALLWAAAFWLLYVAIEPFVRRHWPDALVSWSRLISGRWNDPLVGRDLLVGAVLAVALALSSELLWFVPSPPSRPRAVPLVFGARGVIGGLIGAGAEELLFGFSMLFLLVLLRALVKRTWLAAAILTLLSAALGAAASAAILPGDPRVFAAFSALASIAHLFVLIRFGVLATVLGGIFQHFFDLPLTPDLSAFYAGPPLFALALVFALAVYGARRALSGRPASGRMERLEA